MGVPRHPVEGGFPTTWGQTVSNQYLQTLNREGREAAAFKHSGRKHGETDHLPEILQF
jgi:hypothetical protein